MINSIEWLVEGDSIGLGVALAAGLPHACKIGRQPHEIAAEIAARTPGCYLQRSVILSTGLSNNPNGKAHVRPQLEILSRYARRIVVLGVGPGNDRVKLDGINDWLATLVADVQAAQAVNAWPLAYFAGPLAPPAVGVRMNGAQPGIHAYDYMDIIAQIESVLKTYV
jgi:hypothetical protein